MAATPNRISVRASYKFAFIAVFALTVLAETINGKSREHNVPLLLWSPLPTFTDREVYYGELLNEYDTSELFKDIIDSREDSKYKILFKSAESIAKVNLICVFSLSQFHASDLSGPEALTTSSSLELTVKRSESSVVIPDTTRLGTLKNALNGFEAKSIALKDVESYIQSFQPTGNDQTELLLINVDSDAASIQEMESVIDSAYNMASDMNKGVVFALTGDQAKSYDPKTIPSSRMLLEVTALQCSPGYLTRTFKGKQYCFSHFVYMTPEILSGILFGLFFIFLAYIGISALGSLQTPTRYPLHGPPKGKEF